MRKGETIDHIVVSENGERYRSGGCVELGCYSPPGTYGVTRADKKVRIVWHYSAFSGDRRTFQIDYRFRGLAIAYDDVVDVDLKVWGGEWPVGLARLRASMGLPKPAPIGRRSKYRVFGHPAWVHGDTTRLARFALLRALDIPDHQFVELRAVFPRRLLASTAGAQVRSGNAFERILGEEKASDASFARDRARIDDWLHHNILRSIVVVLAIALIPALLIIAFIWWWSGRERKSDYDREYEQAPPSDLEPALVPPLLRQGNDAGSLEFTATLFDLLRRGRFKSKPTTTERKMWGGIKHEQVSDLEVSQGDANVPLTPFEKPVAEVVDYVLSDGPHPLSKFRDRIDDSRTTNSTRFASFRSNVAKAIDAKKWFVGPGLAGLILAVAAFELAAVILIWAAASGWRSAAPRWSDVVMLTIGICAAVNGGLVLLAALHVRLWRRRRPEAEK